MLETCQHRLKKKTFTFLNKSGKHIRYTIYFTCSDIIDSVPPRWTSLLLALENIFDYFHCVFNHLCMCNPETLYTSPHKIMNPLEDSLTLS